MYKSAGLHLFNRNTGANILIDEIVPPSNKWSAAPSHVSIAITNACDLKCAHCYAPKNQATLLFDNLISWLLDLDKNECIGVGFGGGEPTLNPYFSKLCTYTIEKTNLAVTMTTHGQRISDEPLNELTGNTSPKPSIFSKPSGSKISLLFMNAIVIKESLIKFRLCGVNSNEKAYYFHQQCPERVCT